MTEGKPYRQKTEMAADIMRICDNGRFRCGETLL